MIPTFRHIRSSHCYKILSNIIPIPNPPCNNDVTQNNIPPSLDDNKLNEFQSGNLARFVNQSNTLQTLIKLGVNLSEYDKKKGIPEFIIKLDFERDIVKYIQFLRDNGVHQDNLGKIFTQHPIMFKEDLSDLTARINYLKFMKFSRQNIAYILTKIPYILSMATKDIDKNLGQIQKLFKLKASDMRKAFLQSPRLINHNFDALKLKAQIFLRELDFKEEEIISMFKSYPAAFLLSPELTRARMQYITDTMCLPRTLIIKWPNILQTRLGLLQNRHSYLASLGRAQYDTTRPLYVSPKALVSGTDEEFCTNIAHTIVEDFYEFLKTL